MTGRLLIDFEKFHIILQIFKTLSDDKVLTVDHIRQRLQKKFKDADLDEILGKE